MTENERLKILIKNSPYKTQKEFSEKIGMQSGSISDVLRAKNGLGVSKMLKQKLERILNVNIKWLETGEGTPYNTSLISNNFEGGVPMYTINIQEANPDLSMNEVHPEYFINFKPFNDCTAYLPVFGNTMSPKYIAGDIIAVKEINNFNVLQWGEAYVIFTDHRTNNLKLLKLIHEHPDSSKIILKSSNPNYKGEMIINKENITSLYIVKGKISRNFI
ncbi:LexA family transcriptional regulator [Pedobacter flavus]|uniref:S24 family peptidase n=1 Tax=Pedobacter flavus TaxID=3113906 RepID=A0ABU7GYX9_9SPHI|nr:S24 family peptidase [Pedobacter sp. VNH31]MEE1884170.1 S24 family peptidase [Pedobacter sp. VNH31]